LNRAPPKEKEKEIEIEKPKKEEKPSEIQPEKTEAKLDMVEEESDSLFPSTTSNMSVSFTLKKQPTPKLKKNPRFRDDDLETMYHAMYPVFKKPPSEELFTRERPNPFLIEASPEHLILDGEVKLDFKDHRINRNYPIEYEVFFSFLDSKVPDKARMLFASKKYDSKGNPTKGDKINNNLVLTKVRLKQKKEHSLLADTLNDNIVLKYHNEMSPESFERINQFGDNYIKEIITVRDYDNLLKGSQIRKILSNKDFEETVFLEIKRNWKSKNSLGLYYRNEYREEEVRGEVNGMWSIYLLTLVEDIGKYKISVNDKVIL
jgi:hypothetical protein